MAEPPGYASVWKAGVVAGVCLIVIGLRVAGAWNAPRRSDKALQRPWPVSLPVQYSATRRAAPGYRSGFRSRRAGSAQRHCNVAQLRLLR